MKVLYFVIIYIFYFENAQKTFEDIEDSKKNPKEHLSFVYAILS